MGGDGRSLFLDSAHAQLRPLGVSFILHCEDEADGQLLPDSRAPREDSMLHPSTSSSSGLTWRQEQAAVASEVTMLSSPPGDPFLLAPPKTLTKPVVGQKGM